MVMVSRPCHASLTMFVFLRGHHVLEYYFSVADAWLAANDRDAAQRPAES
jgi:hypothetical protein